MIDHENARGSLATLGELLTGVGTPPASQANAPRPNRAIAESLYTAIVDATTVRLDAWIWAVRAVKTRSMATAECRAGHVRVNGEKVKAAHPVRVGDEVRIRIAGFDRVLEVRRLLAKRTSAAIASECYIDRSPPPPAREERPIAPARDRGAGRPTKRERRELDRLRDRAES